MIDTFGRNFPFVDNKFVEIEITDSRIVEFFLSRQKLIAVVVGFELVSHGVSFFVVESVFIKDVVDVLVDFILGEPHHAQGVLL